MRYVRDGGHLVVSFFSGIVDECDRIHLGGYPAPPRALLGVHVEEFWPLAVDGEVGLATADGRHAVVGWITLEGAEALATFADGELAWRAAITRHSFGRGVAYYLGTRPDQATTGAPAGVEATVRRTEAGERYLFLLNHNEFDVTVPLPAGAWDVLRDGGLAERVDLARRDVVIAKLPGGAA